MKPAIPIVLALVAMVVVASECRADIRDHDGGFLLRLSLGPGVANTSIDGGDPELSGLSGDANFAIGGVVNPNLALHGTFFGWSVTNPDVKTSSGSGVLEGADISVSGVGFGVTYYFMPSNLYLSGTLGFAALDLRSGGSFARTDLGFAIDVSVGKEWWVSERWGLGIAGGLGVHSIPEDGSSSNWEGASLGVRFTSTFN